ncbi:unnamed protein product [Ixodes hexagonus]
MDGGGADAPTTAPPAGSDENSASPLSMQMSNSMIENGLDFEHGEGASAGTRATREDGPQERKRPCGSPSDDDASPTVAKLARLDDPSSVDLDDDFKNDELGVDFGGADDGGDGFSVGGGGCVAGDQGLPVLSFDILDEVGAGQGDEDDDDEDYANNNGYGDGSESDISDDEIEAMLEAGLYTRKLDVDEDEDEDIAHEVKEKVILRVRGHDHFDVLPEGWIQVTHNSGMPVYLHKQSRVCTLSKPYFLGPGSTRKHEVPISAIPCLHYRREKEKEENCLIANGTPEGAEARPSTRRDMSTPVSVGGPAPTPSSATPMLVPDNEQADSQSASNNAQFLLTSVDAMLPTASQCNETLKMSTQCTALLNAHQRRFAVTKTSTGFTSRSNQRRSEVLHEEPNGLRVKSSRNALLVDANSLCASPTRATNKQLTPTNRQHVHHSRKNKTKALPGQLSGFRSHHCTADAIGNLVLALEEAQATRKLMKVCTVRFWTYTKLLTVYLTQQSFTNSQLLKFQAGLASGSLTYMYLRFNTDPAFSVLLQFFDEIKVEDPRVNELCAKTGQLSPYQILLECLKRNYGMGDTEIKQEMKNMKHQRSEFIMSVGKHSASVICRSKRDGKQRASQAILQALHPHITSWGSLLRLYGKGSCKTLKEKKEEEQRITKLQSKASANRPNLCILNKLKEEMAKLKERREAMKPIGKFIPQETEFPSTSASDLKVVEL